MANDMLPMCSAAADSVGHLGLRVEQPLYPAKLLTMTAIAWVLVRRFCDASPARPRQVRRTFLIARPPSFAGVWDCNAPGRAWSSERPRSRMRQPCDAPAATHASGCRSVSASESSDLSDSPQQVVTGHSQSPRGSVSRFSPPRYEI